MDLDLFTRIFNNEFDWKDLRFENIGDIPVGALYDFCNAFPTLIHAFLFLVLAMYRLPPSYRNAIISLYTKISVYSSGIGNGKFLFYVLCGVKTGCPLSSLLFLLCINPILFLFMNLSDNLGFSCTRVCADDFGSALQCLSRLKTQASIFRLAAACAGLILKLSKCVIIVSGVELTDELEAAIRLWLSINIPEFEEFIIASSGKYLGYYLGTDMTHCSFKAPLEKFEQRINEVVDGKAPATTSILRFNQRAVPVLSYVSQFAFPPVNMTDLEMWSIHKILRMPPKCMSRQLCHSTAFCTEVNPICLSAYCFANMLRFAHSEAEYLLDLHAKTVARLQSDPRSEATPLCSIDTPAISSNCLDIPYGGINDPPILVSLLHAFKLTGPFSVFKDNCRIDPNRAWLVEYPTINFPKPYKSFQSSVLAALSVEFSVGSLSAELHGKAKTTLLNLAPFEMPLEWFEELQTELMKQTPYIKVCWLKTITGAWCTSTRSAALHGRNCIFGCEDCRDELTHYLVCPILWQFGCATLGINEDSIGFLDRIGVIHPTSDKFKLLAFSHALYHSCVNDSGCMFEDGEPRSSQIVQSVASDLCSFCKHRVN